MIWSCASLQVLRFLVCLLFVLCHCHFLKGQPQKGIKRGSHFHKKSRVLHFRKSVRDGMFSETYLVLCWETETLPFFRKMYFPVLVIVWGIHCFIWETETLALRNIVFPKTGTTIVVLRPFSKEVTFQ